MKFTGYLALTIILIFIEVYILTYWGEKIEEGIFLNYSQSAHICSKIIVSRGSLKNCEILVKENGWIRNCEFINSKATFSVTATMYND